MASAKRQKEEKKYWLSPAPKTCDTCPNPILRTFYDAKTVVGPWACMCPTCFVLGPGLNTLGIGLGQKYELQPDGKWLKTDG